MPDRKMLKKLVKQLESQGWVKVRQSGSHLIYRREGRSFPVLDPATKHSSQVIKAHAATIRRVLREGEVK